MKTTFRFGIVFVLLGLSASLALAQDNALSQFFANRIYLNPAFAGIEKGLQLTTSARTQWLRADGGYQFSSLSVEWQEPCWRSGVGLTVQYADEGIAPMKMTGGGLTYSYIVPFKRSNLHIGAQYAYQQNTLDWSRLTFSDQLDPVFGSIYGTSAPVGLDKLDFHDFNAGIVWRSDSRLLGGRRRLVRYRSHVGLAVNHLWSLFGQGPDASFLQSGTEIPARITLHGGTVIPLVVLEGSAKKMIVSPNFRLEMQGNSPLNPVKSLTLFTGGAYFIFEQAVFGAYYHSRAPLPGIKHTNALSLSIGFTQSEKELKRYGYFLGLSVDVNMNGVGIRSGNVYELNMRYNFRKIRPICYKKHAATTRKTVMECKDFY
jgi:type IX secretion system PorP/SprF family membrane protein